MAQGIFITGTDTGIGKTTVALGLMVALQKRGLKVAAMKPVSAGCVMTEAGLRNEDAVLLMNQASVDFPYETVNPYAFEPAIAPHIAADECGTRIDIDLIKDNYSQIEKNSDVVIIEGAGGWLVPINENETMADVAKILNLPIILVVGMRLGCLNHSLLTQESIYKSGLMFAGWVANYMTADFPFSIQNQETLEKRLGVPLYGTIPFMKQPINTDIADHIDISRL